MHPPHGWGGRQSLPQTVQGVGIRSPRRAPRVLTALYSPEGGGLEKSRATTYEPTGDVPLHQASTNHQATCKALSSPKHHPVHENGVKSCTAPAKWSPRARKRPQNVHGPGKMATPCMKTGSNRARPWQNGYPVHEKGPKTCTGGMRGWRPPVLKAKRVPKR